MCYSRDIGFVFRKEYCSTILNVTYFLLVAVGFSPLLIAERLDHERAQTTMEACNCLYSNKQTEVASGRMA